MLHERIALASVVVTLMAAAAAVPFAGCDNEWSGVGPASPIPGQDSGASGSGDSGDSGGDNQGEGGGGSELPDGAVPPKDSSSSSATASSSKESRATVTPSMPTRARRR